MMDIQKAASEPIFRLESTHETYELFTLLEAELKRQKKTEACYFLQIARLAFEDAVYADRCLKAKAV